MSGGCLEGVRIVDLTSVVVGPLTTQILADHGADVIKVEGPSGDIGRYLAGKGRNPGMSPKYLHLNRNKRAICLDLKRPAGHAALGKLIESADVLLWNVRPASMSRLGLDYDTVRRIKPDIIYCGMFGFGQQGRYRDMPAYDSIIQGVSGVADLNRRTTGTPAYVLCAGRQDGGPDRRSIDRHGAVSQGPHRGGAAHRSPDVRKHGDPGDDRAHVSAQLRAAAG